MGISFVDQFYHPYIRSFSGFGRESYILRQIVYLGHSWAKFLLGCSSLVSLFVVCSYIIREGLSGEDRARRILNRRLWRVGTVHCIQLWEKELPFAHRVSLCSMTNYYSTKYHTYL